MKQPLSPFLFIFSIILSACLSVGCKKTTGEQAGFRNYWTEYGTITAMRNGKAWTAHITCGNGSDTLKKYSMNIYTLNSSGVVRESIGFANIAFGTYRTDSLVLFPTKDALGHLAINRDAWASYVIWDDGDAVSLEYNIVVNREHSLAITDYNADTKEITGSFSIVFTYNKDTVSFTDGKFYTKIQKYNLPDE